MKTIVNNWHNYINRVCNNICSICIPEYRWCSSILPFSLSISSLPALLWRIRISWRFWNELDACSYWVGNRFHPCIWINQISLHLKRQSPNSRGWDIVMGIALGHESEEHINEYESPRLDLDEILKIN